MKNGNPKNITQMHRARNGEITPQMRLIAETEKLSAEEVKDEVAHGRMVISANCNHKNLKAISIGEKATCKINANIGNSSVASDAGTELKKLELAIKYGSDTVMDLSTGGDINKIRSAILEHSTIPVGTVPMYQIAAEIPNIRAMNEDIILRVIREQAEQGVDFMTIHCGILREHLKLVEKRTTGIVSRGGALTACWMLEHNKENPFYTLYDDILNIAQQYDITLSLGDGLRPGSLADAGDSAQIAELRVLGELTKRAWERDVQVMVEGPGHVPFDMIEGQVKMQQEICNKAPFYVLGPIVTDIAPGYDHITSAIGATMAAFAGASLLCYVTPKEHLGLPDPEDVRQGVIAYKIAAHAADVAKRRPGVRTRDDDLSKARFAFDWNKQFELSLDPERAREMHDETLPGDEHKTAGYCSMCGPQFCAYSLTKKVHQLSHKKGK